MGDGLEGSGQGVVVNWGKYRVIDCFCDKCGAKWIDWIGYEFREKHWPRCPSCDTFNWRAKKGDRVTDCTPFVLFVYREVEKWIS